MRARLLVGAGLTAMGVMMGAGSLMMERVWTFFGPPDLGPVTFETLERRSTPNDALACPPRVCRAPSDVTPPVFAAPPERLKAAMGRVIASEPDVTRVEDAPLDERYIQRTRWMRFPDTIVIRYFAMGEGQSTIALYSRSQFGKGDWGVNRARVERWLAKLSAELGGPRAAS